MGNLDYSYEYLDWWHDDIGEGFRNPAPPRLNWDGEWKTSNEG